MHLKQGTAAFRCGAQPPDRPVVFERVLRPQPDEAVIPSRLDQIDVRGIDRYPLGAGNVAPIGASGREFPQPVSYHVLGNKHRYVPAAVVDPQGQPHHFGA